MDIEDAIDRAIGRYAAHWQGLDPVAAQMAEKIIVLTEYAGGRSAAALAMGVGATTLDNYRMGKTQPKFLELLRLAEAAGRTMEYVIGDTEFVGLLPRARGELKAADIDDELMAKVGSLAARLHEEAGIHLPLEALMKTAATCYNAIAERAEDPSDTDELLSLLPWLETKIRREIAQAREAPGTGKRLA